jgi:hypothetical protein
MRAQVCLALLLSFPGCRPDLGDPASLITGPRILAVRADPPESTAGETVSYRALVATPKGTMSDPPLDWAFCTSPKPLTENGIVSTACLAGGVELIGGPSAVVSAATPLATCSLFGPDTPPGSFRPRDPDTTGGFYQPVRIALGALTAFQLERITCDLPDAPIAVATELAKRYEPNHNPTLEPLVLLVDGKAVGVDQVPAGTEVVLRTGFAASDAETYLMFDPDTLTLVERREALSVSWFVTAGSVADDVTGRAEDDPATTTETTWLSPSEPGVAHVWLVLRDSRGGSDFATYELEVR